MKRVILAITVLAIVIISIGIPVFMKGEIEALAINDIKKREISGGSVKVPESILIQYEKYIETIEETETTEGFVHKEEIGMPKEHQEYLYSLCKKRNLDYLKVLALISLESNFDSQARSDSSDYGYMQINTINHESLSQALNTKNLPLDAYINLNWGTYMLSELYKKWSDKKINDVAEKGQIFSQLDKYVMSSYNKGTAGFKKYGMAKKYISLVEDRYRKLAK